MTVALSLDRDIFTNTLGFASSIDWDTRLPYHGVWASHVSGQSVNETDGKVTHAVNLITGGGDWVQATVDRQPTAPTDEDLNRPVLYADGGDMLDWEGNIQVTGDDSVSFALLAKAGSATSGPMSLLRTTNAGRFSLFLSGTNNLTFQVDDSAEAAIVTAAISRGPWVSIIGAWNATEKAVKLAVNGGAMSSTANASANLESGNLVLFNTPDVAQGWTGGADDVLISLPGFDIFAAGSEDILADIRLMQAGRSASVS